MEKHIFTNYKHKPIGGRYDKVNRTFISIIMSLSNMFLMFFLLLTLLWCSKIHLCTMRLCHPPDGSTSPKYKLQCFITTKIFFAKRRMHHDRCCHLVLCLRLIFFHLTHIFVAICHWFNYIFVYLFTGALYRQ